MCATSSVPSSTGLTRPERAVLADGLSTQTHGPMVGSPYHP
jgi:hypothetical protein